MADYNVGEIVKCLKIFLETKDFDKDSVPCNTESKCGVTTPATKCLCHDLTSKNGNLDTMLKKKIGYFFSQTENLKMNDFIISQGSSVFLTDCMCFGSKNELFQQSGCCSDTIWQILTLIMKTMLALVESLQQIKENEETTQCHQNNQTHLPNIIGIQDQEIICSATEMVVSFGILPNLLPGIGRPLKSDKLPLERSTICPRKLLIITNVLMTMLKNQTLHSIMVGRHLNDMIASLIQLCHCPLKYYDSTATMISQCCCVKETHFKGCMICSSLCQHEKKWCSNELEYILTSTYQPFIIKELLILQRCAILNKKPNCKWLLKVIGHKLSKCVMRDNGVKYVIEGILAGCSSDSMNWQKYKSVGKLIAHVPQVSTAEDYYKLVSPQLLKFLERGETSKGSGVSSQYVMVTVACIEEMLELNCNLAEKYVLEPLLHPLQTSFSPRGIVNLCDDTVSKCLFSVQLLCSVGNALSEKLMNVLSEVLHPLFLIFCLSQDGNNGTPLYSVLVYILHHVNPKECIKWLKIFVFDEHLSESENDLGSTNMKIIDKEAQFIVGMCEQESKVSVDNVATETKIKALLSLLKDKQLDDARGEFFVSLLEQLTHLLQNETKKKKSDEESANSQELKEIDYSISDIQRKIQLVSIISALIDTFEYKILQNTPQTVTFIKGILDLPWEKKKESILLDAEEDFHEETVDLVLMLLSFLLKTEKLTPSDFKILNTLGTSLEKVSKRHSKESSCSLATDLKIYIATRGAVSSEKVSQSVPIDPREIDLTSREAYECALRDLTDPLLPTRGHALFRLSKLLKCRNKYAMKEQGKLLNIFETNLAHDDTYLYLASIEGLLFLVDVHHKDVLPLLCRKFAQFRDDDAVTLSAEFRMKLGEAIVKSCRLIGGMLPVYSQLLLSALLTGVKDPDHLVRASSLSAIGDVCQLSKFSIASISTEIVSCIHHVVSSDKSAEVRRAAIQVFTLMFKGIGSRLLQDIPNKVRDIYHIIKNVLVKDDDELTKLHASNALDILDDVVKETLFTKPKLEKKIQILS